MYDDGTISAATELEGDIRNAPSIIKMNNEHLIIVGSRDDNLYGITESGDIKFSLPRNYIQVNGLIGI